MSDELLRAAARLVRQGMAPTFVGMLDDAGKRALVAALHPLPECGDVKVLPVTLVLCSKPVGHEPPHHGRGVTWGHHEEPRGRPSGGLGDYIDISERF